MILSDMWRHLSVHVETLDVLLVIRSRLQATACTMVALHSQPSTVRLPRYQETLAKLLEHLLLMWPAHASEVICLLCTSDLLLVHRKKQTNKQKNCVVNLILMDGLLYLSAHSLLYFDKVT